MIILLNLPKHSLLVNLKRKLKNNLANHKNNDWSWNFKSSL